MKKSNFTALVLGTVGVVFFALGMCMGLLPQWGMFRQGVVCGVVGLVILLATVAVWRKMEARRLTIIPRRRTPRTIWTTPRSSTAISNFWTRRIFWRRSPEKITILI